MVDNLVTRPRVREPGAKDFRLLPGSPCITFSPNSVTSPVVKARKHHVRPVRLRAGAKSVSPGRTLTLRAAIVSKAASTAASQSATLKIFRAGVWHRVGTMHLQEGRFVASMRLHDRGRKRARRLGRALVPRGLRTLQLRAYVEHTGHSNMVWVRIRR